MKTDILAALAAETWAITPEALRELAARAETFTGDLWADADPDRVEALYAARATGNRSGTVAVVPVLGPISKRDTMWSMFLGGTSTTRLTQQLRALAADDSVATILLNVDSPGGTVSGLPELAAEVRRAAESKHVVAIANDMAASAAYWIASQADEVIATPEALVGSVGVFTMHQDVSGAMEQMGVKTTFIQAGRYKTEGNPFEPLSDDARAHVQSIVDATYAQFVADVAKGRSRDGAPVTAASVKAGYGEGRVLTAKDAKAAGMVDRVENYSQAVARLSGVKPTGMRAEADVDEMLAEALAPIPDMAAEAVRFELDRDAWRFGS